MVCSGSTPPTPPFDNRYTAQAGGNELAPTDPVVAVISTTPGGNPDLTIAAYTASYTFDDSGNRLTKVDSRPGQGTFTYTHDAENRLTQEFADHPTPTPDETINYSYDKNGNTTQKAVVAGNADTYSFDYMNRMATFVRQNSGGGTISNFNYSYAPTGERVMKTNVGSTTQAFMHDGADVIADYTVPAMGVYTYVKSYLGEMGIDSKICEITPAGGVLGYFNTDALGSMHQLLNQPLVGQQPQVIIGSTQLTTAWGEDILSGGGLTRYGFTQRERDEESGAIYFRARTYFPGIGRFGQKDPIYGISDHYVYAANNPARYVDPMGLDPQTVVSNLTQDLEKLRRELHEVIDEIQRTEAVALTDEVANKQYSEALDRLINRIEQDASNAVRDVKNRSSEAVDVNVTIQIGGSRIERAKGGVGLKEALQKELANAFARDLDEYTKDITRLIEEDNIKKKQEAERAKILWETYSGAAQQRQFMRQIVAPVIIEAALLWFGGQVIGVLGEAGGAGKFVPKGGTRALNKSDLGIKGTLTELRGTISVEGGVAKVRIDMIRGNIENPFEIIRNLENTARASGASKLRIEGTLANEPLSEILRARYGLKSEGATDFIEILLETAK